MKHGAPCAPSWADLERERSLIAARLNFAAQVIGWSAAGVGLLVLVAGWWLGHPAAASLIPDQVTMKANAAAGIGLAGLTLVGVTRGWKRSIPGCASGLALVIGAITVAEYAFGWAWSDFDQLLAVESAGAVATAAPGRMGVNTAVDLILLGLAGLLLVFGRGHNVRQSLAAAVTAVTTTALLGWAFDVPALAGPWEATRMALPTALAQLALGAGFLVALPNHGWARVFASPLSGGQMTRIWLPGLLAVLILTGIGAQNAEETGYEELGHQLGLVVTILAVGASLLILAWRIDRLDQERLQVAAAAVDRSEQLYRLGFEGSPVGIGLVDGTGHFLEVNSALAKMLGKSAAEVERGDSIGSISDPDKLASNLAVMQRLLTGAQDAVSFESVLSAVDGRSVPVKLDVVRLGSVSDPMLFGFCTDLTETTEKDRRLTYLAERDPLTGVLNRKSFLERVQTAIDASVQDGTSCAVFFMDIDGFKLINDLYGHPVGDHVLCIVADRLIEETRDGRGWVGRMGGDEFAIALAGCSRQSQSDAARRIERLVAEPMVIDGVRLTASCSIGCAVSDGAALDSEELMARADRDMYAARRAREGGLASRVEELARALESGQLLTYFQPTWALGPDGVTLHGFEALLRWQHPDRGLIPPDEFIGLAEQGGLIPRLDLWAGAEALRRFAGRPEVALAVNCSALTLADPGTARKLIRAIHDIGRDPKSVIVELTESVDVPDNSQIMKSLNELRSEGILIALDDFGSGYAGLNNLRRLPIDIVKIDRSLIEALAEQSDQAGNTEHFLGGIRQLTHAMGTKLLAEGIETNRQLALVRELGFDYGQGFLLGRPRPGEATPDQVPVGVGT